ncbi:MAG TPA: glycerophosphodiester phosphodiesterase [Dehalococcoidia bacterium]
MPDSLPLLSSVPTTRSGRPPLRFAHRGAPVPPVRENTLTAFAAALDAGAEGLESDVWLTADGVPVLLHGAGRLRGRPVGTLRRAELPEQIPSLEQLWWRLGNGFELALDMAAPRAAATVVELARRYGAVDRLWLTYWRLPRMAAWRRRWPEVRLVYATMFGFPPPLFRRVTARCAAAGIDAINLHHRLVGRATVQTAHAADLRLFAWGLRHEGHLPRMRTLGLDGVFIDEVRSSW